MDCRTPYSPLYFSSGNTALLTQIIAAQSAVMGEAPWLDLTDPNLSPEELEARQRLIGQMNEKNLKFIRDNTNFEDFSKFFKARPYDQNLLKINF